MRIKQQKLSVTTIVFLLPVLLLVIACTGEQVEEVVFRETMEYQLEEDCGDDKVCKEAVEAQIAACMEKSDWRAFLNNDEDPQELQRFIKEFFPCFEDPDGNPLFGENFGP